MPTRGIVVGLGHLPAALSPGRQTCLGAGNPLSRLGRPKGMATITGLLLIITLLLSLGLGALAAGTRLSRRLARRRER